MAEVNVLHNDIIKYARNTIYIVEHICENIFKMSVKVFF